MIRFVATRIRCGDLQPGDMFSTAGPEYWAAKYWDAASDTPRPVGERVYLRTNAPCPKDQENETIYRITVVRE